MLKNDVKEMQIMDDTTRLNYEMELLTETTLTPTDDASRDVYVDCLLHTPRWQMGPGCRREPEIELPEQPDDMESIDDNDPEVKKPLMIMMKMYVGMQLDMMNT